MKLSLIGLIFVFVAFSSLSYAQKKKLSAAIYYYQPYCGGARPTQQMEKDAQKPKPYANKKIFLVSEHNKADSVITNELGIFKIKLKPGIYKLFEEWRYHSQTPDSSPINHYETVCLKNEWQKEFQIITVSKKNVKTEEKYTISSYCEQNLPCLLEAFKPPMRQ